MSLRKSKRNEESIPKKNKPAWFQPQYKTRDGMDNKKNWKESWTESLTPLKEPSPNEQVSTQKSNHKTLV